jgi:hypothetical protein
MLTQRWHRNMKRIRRGGEEGGAKPRDRKRIRSKVV